jgi:outer membrane lipoprotein-sorting protein
MRRGAVIAAALLFALATQPASGGDNNSSSETPVEILQSAFDRLFNYTSARRVTMRIHRDGRRVIIRGFDMVYKDVDGEGRTFLRFREPEYLRETALLILEVQGRSDDVWIYLPELRKPRRISTSEKADSFYGSDLTYEDLEHHEWSRYQVSARPDARVFERDCFVLEAIAPPTSQYSRVVAYVEKERVALLRVDFFKGKSPSPVKMLELNPNELRVEGEVLVPARMSMRLVGREGSTEVTFDRIEVGAKIADDAFSVMLLETRVAPFDLIDSGDDEGAGR